MKTNLYKWVLFFGSTIFITSCASNKENQIINSNLSKKTGSKKEYSNSVNPNGNDIVQGKFINNEIHLKEYLNKQSIYIDLSIKQLSDLNSNKEKVDVYNPSGFLITQINLNNHSVQLSDKVLFKIGAYDTFAKIKKRINEFITKKEDQDNDDFEYNLDFETIDDDFEYIKNFADLKEFVDDFGDVIRTRSLDKEKELLLNKVKALKTNGDWKTREKAKLIINEIQGSWTLSELAKVKTEYENSFSFTRYFVKSKPLGKDGWNNWKQIGNLVSSNYMWKEKTFNDYQDALAFWKNHSGSSDNLFISKVNITNTKDYDSTKEKPNGIIIPEAWSHNNQEIIIENMKDFTGSWTIKHLNRKSYFNAGKITWCLAPIEWKVKYIDSVKDKEKTLHKVILEKYKHYQSDGIDTIILGPEERRVASIMFASNYYKAYEGKVNDEKHISNNESHFKTFDHKITYPILKVRDFEDGNAFSVSLVYSAENESWIYSNLTSAKYFYQLRSDNPEGETKGVNLKYPSIAAGYVNEFVNKWRNKHPECHITSIGIKSEIKSEDYVNLLYNLSQITITYDKVKYFSDYQISGYIDLVDLYDSKTGEKTNQYSNLINSKTILKAIELDKFNSKKKMGFKNERAPLYQDTFKENWKQIMLGKK